MLQACRELGVAFVAFTLTMGLSNLKWNQEIIFVGSFTIIAFLMTRLTRELDASARNTLIGTALVIFMFRATPGTGPGVSWWSIDVLGFDQAFFSVLSLIASALTLIGMFLFRRFMAERSILYVVGFLTAASFVLSLPTLTMLEQQGYELHLIGKRWAQSLFAGHGWTVHVRPARRGDAIRQLKALRKELSLRDPGFARRPNYLLFTSSFSSALEGRLAGLRPAGYDRDSRGLLLAHRVPYIAGLHAADLLQVAGQPFGLHMKLPVAQGRVVEDEVRLVGVLLGGTFDVGVQVGGRHLQVPGHLGRPVSKVAIRHACGLRLTADPAR